MIIQIPTSQLPERDPGPYERKRPCGSCGAHLSRSNPGPVCAPCSEGSLPDANNVIVLPARNVVELYPEDAA